MAQRENLDSVALPRSLPRAALVSLLESLESLESQLMSLESLLLLLPPGLCLERRSCAFRNDLYSCSFLDLAECLATDPLRWPVAVTSTGVLGLTAASALAFSASHE